ncbi:MAG: Zn-dependent exopeptidase M28 [Planctomycetota bacterium]|nr:MAG: Zn-dependent exopeptidase M28 [Planctomycetota bacterium]
MVSLVSQSDMLDFLNQLIAISPRPSTTSAGDDAATFIHQTFTGLGAADVKYQTVTAGATTISPNVIVTLAGSTRPDEIYVAGAHYDTDPGSPGADDNGSGMAAIVELLKIFNQYNFEATIMLVAFSGEEIGLHGSSDFAADASANSLDIRGAINLDMIGYVASGDTEDIDLIWHTNYDDGLKDASIAAQQTYVPGFAIKPFNYNDPGIAGNFDSDYTSFWTNGYAAVFFHEDTEEINPIRYGVGTDDIGNGLNSFSLMLNITRTAVATIATLAGPVSKK